MTRKLAAATIIAALSILGFTAPAHADAHWYSHGR